MDVNTGEHYAIYSDRIQKMSVTPKLYLAWDTGNCYKQSKVMPCNLVSTHHSFPPVECHKEYLQHQDKPNHLL